MYQINGLHLLNWINPNRKYLENYIDEMNGAITDFLQKCARLPNANHDDRAHFSDLLHITDTLENLSDETCSLMHTVKKYVSNEKFNSSSQRAKEIEDYVESVRIFYEQVCVYFTIGFTEDEKRWLNSNRTISMCAAQGCIT